jgi:anti-anti-sigma factor
MRFHVNTLLGHTTAVVRCRGDIILGQEADLFHEVVERLQKPVVLLDMGEVRAIDAYGLGRLASLVKQRRDRGKDLVVVNPQPLVLELLQLTKLDLHISISNLFVPTVHCDCRGNMNV